MGVPTCHHLFVGGPPMTVDVGPPLYEINLFSCQYRITAANGFFPFPALKAHCKQRGLQVDHGPKGMFRLHEGDWHSVTGVHALTLTPKRANSAQGSGVRIRYVKLGKA